jgi:penicillin G amidase
MRRTLGPSLLLGTLLTAAITTSPTGQAMDGWSQLDVNGDRVRIYRDEYGVPHIFAETSRGLYEAYGYVIAEARLWQLEMNRRAGRGRLAEILGAGSAMADRTVRTLGYTDAELDEQFAQLPAADQERFESYVRGINRYVDEVVVPDPPNKLPFEFHHLGIGVPVPWTAMDAFAFGVREMRGFLERGDGERATQALLNSLVVLHGLSAGLGVFNDVQWTNDPDGSASVPQIGAIGKKQHNVPPPSQLAAIGAEAEPTADEEAARAISESLGIPMSLGSHGWVVSAAHSREGGPMLFGGPQLASSTPDMAHEVQLKGPDVNVAGMSFAGIPSVLIGRTSHIAWTAMTAFFNNVDTYIETLCNAGGGAGSGYLFNGVCTPYERRTETIQIKGSAPLVLTVERSIHGPVIAATPLVKFTRKSIQWQREFRSLAALSALQAAHNVDEFQLAMEQMVGALNVLYADKGGNIAFWRPGEIPARPAGYDIRLPLPGDGSAEWTDEALPIPMSINPTRGWLANWNNKATVDDETDALPTSKQSRVVDIEARLVGGGPFSRVDMLDIAKDISRTTPAGGGKNSRFLIPYLFHALDVVPSVHPLTQPARAVLEAWDGSLYDDAIASSTLAPGQVVFSTWLRTMFTMVFGDELGANIGTVQGNTLIHVLDDRLGSGSGVPPSRDYFNGADPNAAMSAAFTSALDTLGPDSSAWSTQPRDVTRFRHALYPAIPEVGAILESNKGSYAQLVVLKNPRIQSENIFTLGQSGFIRRMLTGDAELSTHFRDQLPLYQSFLYKPMRLFVNTRLEH